MAWTEYSHAKKVHIHLTKLYCQLISEQLIQGQIAFVSSGAGRVQKISSVLCELTYLRCRWIVCNEHSYVRVTLTKQTRLVIQLAKLDGLKVIGSAGSEEKVKFMKEIGADVAFNYKTTSTNEILAKEGPIDVLVGPYRSPECN